MHERRQFELLLMRRFDHNRTNARRRRSATAQFINASPSDFDLLTRQYNEDTGVIDFNATIERQVFGEETKQAHGVGLGCVLSVRVQKRYKLEA